MGFLQVWYNHGMTRLEIALPDEIQAAAEAQASQRGYPNAKAYVESLVSSEIERRRAKAALEAKLIEALDTPAREITAADWAEMRRRFEERRATGP